MLLAASSWLNQWPALNWPATFSSDNHHVDRRQNRRVQCPASANFKALQDQMMLGT